MNAFLLLNADFETTANANHHLPMRTMVWSEGDEGAEVRYTTHGERDPW